MTSPPVAAELAALVQESLAQIGQQRRERIDALPYDARRWLAAVPAWTFGLADAVGFPDEGVGIAAIVAAMQREGLCETATPVSLSSLRSDPAHTRFWMTSAARTAFLDDDPGYVVMEGQDLGYVIGDIGRRIVERAPGLDDDTLPPLVRRWAELARFAPNVDEIAAELARRVNGCLPRGSQRDDDAISQRPAQALAWIDAARPLGEALGDAVGASIRQQSRRIDLVYRRRDDERQVAHFLLRDGPNAAFERLISGPDAEWALHFVGAGGVGKTMLMRYISGVWAANGTHVTARIDFDYLNPEFPVRAPALLLAQLMQDLRLHADESADRSFAFFESTMLAFHERTRNAPAPPPGANPEGFDRILDLFTEAVRLLNRPVVLLLDTCEELAKARIGRDGLPENVRATFHILEQLHARLHSMRVVFCGRRPLASGGIGWSLPGVDYPPRSYLALHQLLGFTEDEAVRYFRKERIPEPLIDPILTVSVDHGVPLDIRRTGPELVDVPATRFLPFSLSLYARWWRDDPTLSAETIRSGDADPYVEYRVYARVRRPALVELVPVMALVGRFDRALLRAVSTRSDAEFDAALDELREQEWIHQAGEELFEVLPHLQERLRAYLRRRGLAVMSNAKTRALAHLERVTIEQPLATLTLFHFEAATLLLRESPARAFAWWDAVEARFADRATHAWLRELVRRMLSADGPVVVRDTSPREPAHPLRGAILATYAALLAQNGETSELTVLWSEAAAFSDLDPRPGGAARQRLRTAAGHMVAAWQKGESIPGQQIETFLGAVRAFTGVPWDDRSAAPAVAGFEAIVERAEIEEALGTLAAPWYAALDEFTVTIRASAVSAELIAFAALLRARVTSWRGDAVTARGQWAVAREAAGRVTTAHGAARSAIGWLDWRMPDDFQCRVDLEYARSVWPAIEEPSVVLDTLGGELRPPRSIDADRLDAVLVALTSASRVSTSANAMWWTTMGIPPASADPRCNAHRSTLPFHVTYWVAEALQYGQIAEALAALRVLRADAEKRTNALDLQRAIDLGELHIIRRMRLTDEGRDPSLDARALDDVDLVNALSACLAFDGPGSASAKLLSPHSALELVGEQRYAAWAHGTWRALPATNPVNTRRAIDWIRGGEMDPPSDRPDPGTATPHQAACLVDAIEARLVMAESESQGLTRDDAGASASISDIGGWIAAWIRAHPASVEHHVRLGLRLSALHGDGERWTHLVSSAIPLCGARRAAEIALDEGELLALRLPAQSRRILRTAGKWFAAAEDWRGAFLSAVCESLAATRVGDPQSVARALDRARQAYAALVADTTDLPSLVVIEAVAENPTLAEMSTLTRTLWRPWLIRFIAASSWYRDSVVGRGRSEAVSRWLVDNFGTRIADAIGSLLSPELEPWAPTDRDRSRSRVRPVATAQSGSASSVFHIRIGGGGDTLASPTAGDRVPRIITVQAGDIGSTTARTTFDLAAKPGEQVADVADTHQGALDLATLWREMGKPPRIELSIAHALARIGWEHVIEGWLIGTDSPATITEPLVFVRRPPQSRGMRSSGAWRDVSTVRSHAGSAALVRMTTQGWDRVRRSPAFRADIETGWNDSPSTRAENAAVVVHLVGAPIEVGSGGVALQLARTSAPSTTIIYNERADPASNAPASVGPSASREGVLLRMQSVLARYPGAAVVALQANPISGRDRNSADRECGGYLRTMASELASLGVGAVLVIPPVPTDDAIRAIDALANAVLDHDDATLGEALRTAFVDVRRVIDGGSLQADADRKEASADVCLFLAYGPEDR